MQPTPPQSVPPPTENHCPRTTAREPLPENHYSKNDEGRPRRAGLRTEQQLIRGISSQNQQSYYQQSYYQQS